MMMFRPRKGGMFPWWFLSSPYIGFLSKTVCIVFIQQHLPVLALWVCDCTIDARGWCTKYLIPHTFGSLGISHSNILTPEFANLISQLSLPKPHSHIVVQKGSPFSQGKNTKPLITLRQISRHPAPWLIFWRRLYPSWLEQRPPRPPWIWGANWAPLWPCARL